MDLSGSITLWESWYLDLHSPPAASYWTDAETGGPPAFDHVKLTAGTPLASQTMRAVSPKPAADLESKGAVDMTGLSETVPRKRDIIHRLRVASRAAGDPKFGSEGANANASKNSLCAVNVWWAKRKRKKERENRGGEERGHW